MGIVTYVAVVRVTGEMSIMGRYIADAGVESWQSDLGNGSLATVLSKFWEFMSQVRQWSNQQFDSQNLCQAKGQRQEDTSRLTGGKQ